MAFTLKPSESVRRGLTRCATEQLERAEHALRDEFPERPVEAVHEARKAIKKQRALQRLSRGTIAAAERRHENATLRDAARRLSDARDADVLLETLDALVEHAEGRIPNTTFRLVREHLERHRPREHSPVDVEAVADELHASYERVANFELHRGGWKALEPGLLRTYRSGRRAFARAVSDPSDASLHEWRRRVKDLWYALRLLSASGGAPVKGQAKEAHRLADLLGDDHDLAVLAETLSGIEGMVADREWVIGALEDRRHELQAHARAAGERVYAEKPGAFRRRIRALWRAGRHQAKIERTLRRRERQAAPIAMV
jgi:CHAD domain-containing protein